MQNSKDRVGIICFMGDFSGGKIKHDINLIYYILNDKISVKIVV